ncbi:MAG: EAL domain-containing protein, partial [Firmicutes bacterium]|nr:EAL domain-containing protein [Bacillota bacterium]
AIGRLDEVVGPQHSLLLHVGVYEIAKSDNLVSVMFDRAAMAINDIRDNIDKRIAYYSDHMRNEMLWEQKIAESLDDAVARGCVVPFLQAQVDRSGKLAGAEVLVRWNHDEEGLLLPDSFISILEKNGSIAKVDRYIWECACRILQKWTLEGNTDLYLSVNISPRDFYLLDVPETLSDLTTRYGIDRSRLRLEITETIMMDDVPMKLDIIGRLRSMGFILEMDDFGSGYSSLNMLKDMPVDVIKLDMIFMSGTTNSERNDKIVNLIVKLAGELGMNVIAEGVETLDQVNSLTAMGCHAFQGYYFSRPIPLSEFESRHVG